MFAETYAENRTDVNEGHKETLQRLCEWLEDGEPFCHIRLADGEFMSITDTPPPGGLNGDGSTFFPDMKEAFVRMLDEMAALHPNHGRLLVGGDWAGKPEHRQYLVDHNLFRRIPWVASGVFADGVESGAVMRWLQGLRSYKGKIILVGCKPIAPAASFMRAKFVTVPLPNAWLATAQVEREVMECVQPGDMAIYCAGQACKPWAWKVWNETEKKVSVVDMGHFFDLACGLQTRYWHEETCLPWASRRWAYERTCMPFILMRKTI